MYLREMTEEDLNKINLYRNDKNLSDLLVAPFRFINIETDNKWFMAYMNNRSNNVRCVICNDKDDVIGMIYLLNIDWIYRSAEFGIVVGDENFRGKGIGKLATIEMLRHAFYNMNLNRVQLRALVNNTRAIGLYESVGFKEEGILREAVFKNGQYYDLKVMSILKGEFKH